MTHQQMLELIKLNEKINDEIKKDPNYNARDLIVNSVFVQSIKELNFKEICSDLIEMNPGIFRPEDFEDVRYLATNISDSNGYGNNNLYSFEPKM